MNHLDQSRAIESCYNPLLGKKNPKSQAKDQNIDEGSENTSIRVQILHFEVESSSGAANASIECVMVFSNVPSKISSIRDDPDFKPRDFPPDVCKFKKPLDQSEQRAEMFAINQFKSKVNESFDEKFPIRAISSLQIPQPSPPCKQQP